MKPIFSPTDDAYLIQHYPLFGAVQCASVLGCEPKQVRSRMGYLRKRDGLDTYIPPIVISDILSRALTKTRKPEDYKVNPTHFTKVTTPEAAYILGLLWADGCVHIRTHLNTYLVIISAIAEDLQSVEHVFDTTGRWAKCPVKRNNARHRPQLRFSTNGKLLAIYLASQGYCSKTGTPHILSAIPDHLKNYWFRGLMDGDGCFYIAPKGNHASISGPRDQDWSYLTKTLDSLHVEYKISMTKSNRGWGSSITIRNLASITRWGNYLYQGYEQDGIGFPRKRIKFLEIEHRFKHSAWHLRRIAAGIPC